MVSSLRIGHPPLGVGFLLAGLIAVGCGTNQVGLPDVDTGVGPEPMKPDASVRTPPVLDPPDASPPPPPVDASMPDRPDAAPNMCQPPNVQCSFGYFQLKPTTPELVLVFDRSSAMLRMVPGTASNRWNEMAAAIEDNLGRTNAAVLWGLKLFPSSNVMCDVTESLDVPVALSNLNPIVMRIRGSMPMMGMDGSPLDQGVKAATRALLINPSNNPRYLVLATDGIPNCPVGAPGETEAVKAVVNQAMMGVRTYVIGTATPASPQHRTLNDLAAAGGEPRAGEQKYFQALDKAQMVAALDEITSRMSSCVLRVNGNALPPAPDFVAMNIGNMRIPRDPARREGWNWGGAPNLRIVHVYGEACNMLKKNPLANPELVFGCDGFPPPPPCGM